MGSEGRVVLSNA